MIDLHIHSKKSDGQDDPWELPAIAAEAGVTVMALTDHDNVQGIEEAKAAAEALGIEFIGGVEISTSDLPDLHILGYGISGNDSGLIKFYEENRCHRIERRDKLIELFNKNGIPITLSKIEAVNEGKSSGRPHIARTLVEMGYAESVQDAFDRYFSTPEYSCTERPKPTARMAIDMIKNAGGVPVLAHPYALELNDEDFRNLLERLISYGLKGLECFYSKHTCEEREYYLSAAKEYGLLVTVGSDYHGPDVKPDIKIGSGCNGSLFAARPMEQQILNDLRQAINISQK